MSAFFNEDRIRVEAIGTPTTIPDSDVARLMYYLSCVNTVISYDEINKFSDYRNYNSLNLEEKEILLKLVELLKPEIFIKAGIFIKEDKLIPNNYNNEFYKITDQRIGIHISQEIMIGGKFIRVLKIMACNDTWLNKYYYEPIKSIYEMKTFMLIFGKALISLSNDSNKKIDNNKLQQRKKKKNEGCCIIW